MNISAFQYVPSLVRLEMADCFIGEVEEGTFQVKFIKPNHQVFKPTGPFRPFPRPSSSHCRGTG